MSLKEIIPYVFLDIAIVIVAARLVGRWFQKLGQPAVIGEIVAGIILGPTILGLFPGDLHLVLFPVDARPYLTVIAQVGLVLFMFLVGLEVDLSLIRSNRRTAATVSLSSIVLPFVLGAALATWLYSSHSVTERGTVPPLAFSLFIGIAMSITAFPVLARILTERRMHRIPLGVLALSCAAIDDVVAWSLLAVVIAVAVGGTFGGVGLIIGLTVLFAAFMFLVVRPLLARLVDRYRHHGRLTPDILAVVLVGLLLSAWATEEIGVHAIFGAFLFGVVMPRAEPGLTRAVLGRLEQVALTLLLPVFFVVAGLQVDVSSVGLRGLLELAAILAVAIGGKLLGATLAARLQRVPWRPASALGLLMNTRGLTEIVILQVGLQLGVLDQNLFTLMVLMALITTIMTEPLLRRVYPDRMVQRDIADAERAELGDVDAFTVLTLVPEGTSPDAAARLVRTAHGLTGRQRPARVVLCRLLHRTEGALELASGIAPDLTAVATAGDELRRLAAALDGTGVNTGIVVRFAADPAAEVENLVQSLGAEVVLAEEPTADPGGEQSAPPVPTSGTAAVVLLRIPVPDDGAARSGVTALVDGGAGGRAVLRLAAQLALHHGTALAVAALPGRRGAGRQAATAVAALARAGVPVSQVSAAPTGRESSVLVPDGVAADLRDVLDVLVVRESAADVDDDLHRALGRVTVEAATGPEPGRLPGPADPTAGPPPGPASETGLGPEPSEQHSGVRNPG